MGIRTDRPWKQQIILLSLIIMLVGLFVSRALLSISMFAFLVLTVVHKDLVSQLRNFISSRLLVAMGLLFLVFFISGLWSDDKQIWWRFTRIKLPLLLLPLAFAGNWQVTTTQWKWIAYTFIILVFGGVCWSFWQYLENVQDIHKGYLKAKVVPTPFENDHVRFSLAVAISILCCVFVVIKSSDKREQILLAVAAIIFTVYLHILSARTGLISLYIILFLGAFYLLFSRGKTKWTIAVCLAAVAMPALAWFAAPTFQNRIRYFIYDFSYIRNDTYLPGANDGNRMLSIDAGWNIVKQHPFGVGSGDIMEATTSWYDKNIQGMLESDKIYPSSEWMMYGAAAGWLGILAFTIAMLVPFYEKIRSGRFFWIALNTISAFSFLFDIGLEAQFGVFLYAFTVLWWWKWMRQPESALS